jgi:hypothetical protein
LAGKEYNAIAMGKALDNKGTLSTSDEIASHLLWVLEMDRTINLAVRKAQEENRRLGIPNYYVVNGRIVSDQPDKV